MTEWFYPRKSAPEGDWELSVGAAGSSVQVDGWQHTGIKVAATAPGQTLGLPAAAEERFIVPLTSAFDVAVDGVKHHLRGRANPFAGPTDVLYIGIGKAVVITSAGVGRVAVATAPATVAYPTTLIRAEDTAVELRGNGATSREVHNFGMVGKSQADKIMVCEVITPAGNWSSYPPHKHDRLSDQENLLEEIYYYEVRSRNPSAKDDDPMGFQRVSSTDERPIDIATEVRSGDLVLVPYGWHGPSMAMPGYDLYYLNVMAGPGERAWKVTVAAGPSWVPESLKSEPIDPRLPLK
ncbi:MAG: 5-deoxy-glucuronate isomerase [Ancalomicrobiaceae bacterium]|nr:5-deoxy-glucuronate isomerase [Ancalomicrobiaceae bacterium]